MKAAVGVRGLCGSLTTILAVAALAAPAAAETKTYVVSYFAQQFSNTDGDCPGGINPDDNRGQTQALLIAMGYPDAEVKKMMADWDKGGDAQDKVDAIVDKRAVIDGKQVNPYTHPEASVDPGLKFVEAKYAYGFNLDGRNDADDFIDPITKEEGVDHQLFRAIGCNQNFRGSWTGQSAYGEWVWVQLKDSQPAWLITITGDDLKKDGEVTIKIDRALEHLESNANGTPRFHMTYRLDPDPRSHNEFKGAIRDGVITLTEHKPFSILWNGLSAPVLNLSNTHLRLVKGPQDTLDGVIAGFQPWRELYFAFSHNGIVGDRPGLWHSMKRAADAEPDPASGQNMAISATYRLSAVPAFIVPVERESAAR